MLGIYVLLSERGNRQTLKYTVDGTTTTNHFLSGEIVGYCGMSTRNFAHIADIEFHRYVHLDEIICGRIGDMCPAPNKDNDSIDFVLFFVNQDMLADTSVIPLQQVLHANIAQLFSVNRVVATLPGGLI